MAKKKSTTRPATATKPKPPKSKSTTKSTSTPSRKLKLKWWIVGGVVLSLAVAAILLALLLKDLPSPRNLATSALPVSTIITDRNDQILYEIYADQNRNPIHLKDLPAHVAQATIAIEDGAFYRHFGFSIQGMTRAMRNTLFSQKLQGGSTITQQLVKVGLLTPERTIERKIREAILTVAVEVIYSKDDILEMYLNHIPYGGTAYGIQAAAQTFFGKDASELTLPEAAYLAGLPQAPSRYSPFGSSPELGKNRQAQVLRRMVEEGFITPETADSAAAASLQFASDSVNIKAPHFSLYIKDILTEKYGLTQVERGGLRVKTSLDLNLQQAAEASLAAELAELEDFAVGNGAALVTNPQTGEILAMVGSKNFFDFDNGGQVNVTLRNRQPGSSIKPLTYAVGIDAKRFTAGTMLLDIPTCFRSTGQPAYCPKNYDNSFRGPTQVRYALGNSYNIPAVKALALVSVEDFIASASAMGITTFTDPSRYGLSLTLGGGEVRMIDMAVAFGSLATGGYQVPLQPILEVRDWQGKVFEQYQPQEIATFVSTSMELATSSATPLPPSPNGVGRVFDPATAWITTNILSDNGARVAAFGPNSALVIPRKTVAVKTGTTNNLRDNWTIGYSPNRLVAVWVGNNDNTPMNPRLVSGVTGAAPIWNDIMTYALLEFNDQNWPRPANVIERPICRVSGLVSHPDRPCELRNEFFIEGTEPGVFDQLRREIWVKADTGFQPAPEDTENLKLEEHTVLSDPFVKEYCVDCALPLNEQGKPIQPQTTVTYPLVTESP